MKLYGYDPVSGGRAGELLPPAGRKRGLRFAEELQKATDAAKAGRTKDAVELVSEDAALRALYDRLTPASRDVLERAGAEEPAIGKEEWNSFCKELQDLGAVTEDDVMYTRSDLRLIPIGYYDRSGAFVMYETPPMLKDRLLELSGSARGKGAAYMETSGTDWAGDPLKYLDGWASALYSWRSDMARLRNADGSPKYDHFSPLTDQIDACRKVSGLVRKLGKLCG